MRTIIITIVADADDQTAGGDYPGQLVTNDFIQDYLMGAYGDGPAELVPGLSLTAIAVADLLDDGELASLRKDSEKLGKLEAAGVDNWDGYSQAFADDGE